MGSNANPAIQEIYVRYATSEHDNEPDGHGQPQLNASLKDENMPK